MPVPLNQNQVNEVKRLGNEVAQKYPRAFSKCHVDGDPEKMDFIILFAQAAKKNSIIGATHLAGMNGKRGNPSDPSLDVLDFLHSSATNDRDVTAADVVSGAGGPNPTIVYNDVTDPNGAGAIYLNPDNYRTYYDYGEVPIPNPPNPNPNPPSGSAPPYPSEPVDIKEYETEVQKAYTQAGRPLNDPEAFRWFTRPMYDYTAKNFGSWKDAWKAHLKVLREQLGLPPE